MENEDWEKEREWNRDVEVEMEVDGMARGQKEGRTRMVDEDVKMGGTEEGKGSVRKEKRGCVVMRSEKKGKGRERDGEDGKDVVEEMRMRVRGLEAEGARRDGEREAERAEARKAADDLRGSVMELKAERVEKEEEVRGLREEVKRLGEMVRGYEEKEREGKGKADEGMDLEEQERRLAMARGGLREIDEMMKECGFCAM